MKFLTALYPRLVSFFRGCKGAKVDLLSIKGCSGLEGGAARVPTDALWKISRGQVSFSVSTVVPDILGVRTNPKVLKAVVKGVPVNVVDDHSLFRSNSVQGQDDSVNHHLLVNATEISIYAHVCRFLGAHLKHFRASLLSGPSGVGSLPKQIRSEVVSRPVSPEQFSSFRFVSKRLLKKFDGGQLFSRMHNQSFGYVFRRIGICRSLCAAFFSVPVHGS